MKKRVVVTGLGVVSSLGIGKDIFWESLINGKSGISSVTSIDTSLYNRHLGAEIRNFVPEEFVDKKLLKFMPRATQLTVAGVQLALKDSGLKKDGLKKRKMGLCLGTTFGNSNALEKIDRAWLASGSRAVDRLSVFQSLTTNAVSFVAREYGISGPTRIFTTACASGNYAIGAGYDFIQSDEAGMVICGGMDGFGAVAFTGFHQFRSIASEKVQPFDKNREGMMLGEGAGMLILESLDSALARKAVIYAEISGYGLSCDACHVANIQADGIYRCMSNAMEQTGILAEDIDYISAHGTGTKLNDRVETEAIKKLLGKESGRVLVSSIKSMLGHALGAASALEAIACCLTVQNDMVPPTINYDTPDPECDLDYVPNVARRARIEVALNNGFAFGGNNSCLVVKKFVNQ